jgi:hypothetical protein
LSLGHIRERACAKPARFFISVYTACVQPALTPKHKNLKYIHTNPHTNVNASNARQSPNNLFFTRGCCSTKRGGRQPINHVIGSGTGRIVATIYTVHKAASRFQGRGAGCACYSAVSQRRALVRCSGRHRYAFSHIV